MDYGSRGLGFITLVIGFRIGGSITYPIPKSCVAREMSVTHDS